MLVPVLVTPPVGQVVSLEELRAQCRLGPNSLEFDDQLIVLGRAAVSHLDGHHGILGRCILEQQWAVTLTRPGCHRLPFPDVTAVESDTGTTSLLWPDPLGSRVEVSRPCVLTMTAALPPDALPAVRQAVCIWVQKRFDGLTGPEAASFDLAFNSLIAPLRWTRI